jgi:hypothetical protein
MYRLGADNLATHLPLALSLQHVQDFFVNTMNMEAGGTAGPQRAVEDGRLPRVLSSHEERHRPAGQRNFLAFSGHSNDRSCSHY